MSSESLSLAGLLDDHEAVLLLQTIWDLIPERMRWPNYSTVDRLMHRDHSLDIDPIIARMPPALLRGGRPQGDAAPGPEDQLALTAPAAAVCNGSIDAIAALVAAARLAAEIESEPIPSGEQPAVTFEQVAGQLQFPSGRCDLIARQSGLLVLNEPWSESVGLYQGGWKATVDRRVRRYAEVSTWEQYMAVRESQTVAQPVTPVRQMANVVSLDRRWVVGAAINSGGFGEIFHATGEDGTAAAIKFVPKEPGADREQLFVDLPGVRNVVPVIDQGEHDNHWVLVMPLASGTLADRIRQGALPIDEAVEVLRDLAATLADLADLNPAVVHRDLKPANILRLGDTWCVADFGISRYAEAATDRFTHKFAMSVQYAAPERWNGARATAAVDVYALGVVMHELLTGRLPFPGPDYRDQHLHHAAPSLPADAPPRLAALIDGCMAKPAEARPSPAQVWNRAERPFQTPRSGAAQALADANRLHAESVARQDAAASQAQTEEQRRTDLNTVAVRSLAQISDELLGLVRDLAPTAQFTERSEGWSVHLDRGRLLLSTSTPFEGNGREGWTNPPFDVIAFATISIYVPDGGQNGYHGRSHSLYYCDPYIEGSYGWHETAFMMNPLRGGRTPQDPFALDPGGEAVGALRRGASAYQVAREFARLDVGDLDDFNDRWIDWFAQASRGQLGQPLILPEGNIGTWRTNG